VGLYHGIRVLQARTFYLSYNIKKIIRDSTSLVCLLLGRFIEGGYRKLALFAGPAVHLNYQGFEWVVPWQSATLEKLHVITVFMLAVFIMVGFCYRISATIFFFMFTHLWMQEVRRIIVNIVIGLGE
jgi:hypothetical protein